MARADGRRLRLVLALYVWCGRDLVDSACREVCFFWATPDPFFLLVVCVDEVRDLWV